MFTNETLRQLSDYQAKYEKEKIRRTSYRSEKGEPEKNKPAERVFVHSHRNYHHSGIPDHLFPAAGQAHENDRWPGKRSVSSRRRKKLMAATIAG
ncbi:MAG: hypothetical protein MZV63_36680 [Marinilabiliales bacterium]|nr:hypothetical protein [Marinilabiliales bacterium]